MGIVTVTVPPAGAALTTLNAVKASLGIAPGDTSADARLTTLIGQVSASIATYLRRRMGRYTATEAIYMRGQGHVVLVVSDFPASVTNVTLDGVAMLSADYIADGASGMVFRSDGERWRGNIVVTYSAGWKLPGDAARDLPEDIEAVAIAAVAASYYADGRDPALRSEQIEGTGEVQFFSAATSGAVGAPGAAGAFPALDAYRLWP